MKPEDSNPIGIVYLVGAGPGDPGLITMRAVNLLKQADVVVYDRLCAPQCLVYAEKAEKIYVGKHPDHHPVPQSEINLLLVEHARAGKVVVRLKGGDPFVFGRGGEEAQQLSQAGIPFEIVPGVTSAVAAPAYAGIPVTFREIAKSVAFITGHTSTGDGGPEASWEECYQMADTLVYLMGVSNLAKIVERLLAIGRAPQTPVALIQQGTTPHQVTVTGTLADIVERARLIKSPAVIVIGEVVNLREQIRWYDVLARRPLLGLHIVNTRPQVRIGSHQEGRDPFGERLAELGAGVAHIPAFQIVPNHDLAGVDAAIRRIAAQPGAYVWVVFTSANAVRAFCERLLALGFDARLFGGTRIAAVGTATAESLREYTLSADFLPETFRGGDLGRELDVHPGERVLLPQSAKALPDLAQALQQRGVQVEAVTAYEHMPSSPDDSVLTGLAGIKPDLCAFFSPSGVSGLIAWQASAAAGPTAHIDWQSIPAACIGPTTAAAAAEAGFDVQVIPEKFTADALIEAIIQWRARL